MALEQDIMALEQDIKQYFIELMFRDDRTDEFFPWLLHSETHADGMVELEGICIVSAATMFNDVLICTTLERLEVSPGEDWQGMVDDILLELHLQFTENYTKVCQKKAKRERIQLEHDCDIPLRPKYWRLVDEEGMVVRTPWRVAFMGRGAAVLGF